MHKKIKAFFASAAAFMYSLMTAAYADNGVAAVDTSGIKNFIWNIVNALMDVAVVVAVGFIAWNGYKIMASSTNPARRSEAMTGLLWSILGAIVALGAKWFVGVALGFKPQ
ncbi:pilin [Thermoanaerobacter thermocopriae]|uniref:pilin n=1 Tax=Thermoanaerobacter thermocopriae TaxID=29350 RepID=UPI0004AFF750|nr:pilin [Thermoanaerobacter thermocopriae]